ncbi:MAG: MBL fold metallo-hydrolase [Candidatus Omnitrophota bacterium]|nr:MBL fold metallo-hydrolase [Candidatus Omnitrophota bacterium]
MILEAVTVGPMQVNCYILAAGKDSPAIIIDPGSEPRKIKQVLAGFSLRPEMVINTHGHYDHIGADDAFAAPIYIHAQDGPLLKDPRLNLSGVFGWPYAVKGEIKFLEDNQAIGIAGIELKVLHLPGHTPGGIALQLIEPRGKVVFTGDTLFSRSVGRSDLQGGDGELLVKGIKEKLLILGDDTAVYPGHGPETTIGEEKRGNPYLQE